MIDVGGAKLPWDLTRTEDGGPGFPYFSVRFSLVVIVAISVFDFVSDILYFVVIVLEGDGAYFGFQRPSLFIVSILALTMPSVLYAFFMGFPTALCRGWVQTARSFPTFYLRYTFGIDTFKELWTAANPVTPPRASQSGKRAYLFRLVELSAGEQDWCSSMERAVVHLACLLFFLGSSMVLLAATCMLTVLTLFVLWPAAVIVCLALGMNLKLFLFAPFSAWVTTRLMRVTQTQATEGLNIYQTNMSLIIEELFEALPEIAIILINENLRGGGLSPPAMCAIPSAIRPCTHPIETAVQGHTPAPIFSGLLWGPARSSSSGPSGQSLTTS